MILLIDNYDSFTYNVYQCVAELGHRVVTARNDRIDMDGIASAGYKAMIISPGPGTPGTAGLCKDLVARFAGKIPILGICLGHQTIGEVFGGEIIRAPRPIHGKTSLIYHNGQGIYRGLPQPFAAARYHSLVVGSSSLPDCLEVTAALDDGLIMGLRHRHYCVEGIQFHPESILTPQGNELLKNFLSSYC